MRCVACMRTEERACATSDTWPPMAALCRGVVRMVPAWLLCSGLMMQTMKTIQERGMQYAF